MGRRAMYDQNLKCVTSFEYDARGPMRKGRDVIRRLVHLRCVPCATRVRGAIRALPVASWVVRWYTGSDSERVKNPPIKSVDVHDATMIQLLSRPRPAYGFLP